MSGTVALPRPVPQFGRSGDPGRPGPQRPVFHVTRFGQPSRSTSKPSGQLNSSRSFNIDSLISTEPDSSWKLSDERQTSGEELEHGLDQQMSLFDLPLTSSEELDHVPDPKRSILAAAHWTKDTLSNCQKSNPTTSSCLYADKPSTQSQVLSLFSPVSSTSFRPRMTSLKAPSNATSFGAPPSMTSCDPSGYMPTSHGSRSMTSREAGSMATCGGRTTLLQADVTNVNLHSLYAAWLLSGNGAYLNTGRAYGVCA